MSFESFPQLQETVGLEMVQYCSQHQFNCVCWVHVDPHALWNYRHFTFPYLYYNKFWCYGIRDISKRFKCLDICIKEPGYLQAISNFCKKSNYINQTQLQQSLICKQFLERNTVEIPDCSIHDLIIIGGIDDSVKVYEI